MKQDSVEIRVLQQGDAVAGKTGYMLKCCNNVAAFYLDGGGETGHIYPLAVSQTAWNGEELLNFPSMTIEDGRDSSDVTEICFPEFEGWRVHSALGGKTMAISLTKE